MRWVWLVFALLSAGVIGCGNRNGASDKAAADKAAIVSALTEMEAPPAAQAPAPADGFMAVNEERAKFAPGAAPDAISRVPSRKLIRTVQLDVVVAQVDSMRHAMQALAIEAGGYVAQVDAHLENGVPHARVSLRVPVDRLDETLVALRRLSVRIDREQQNVQDVTEQWVDLDARLRTLQATEQELLALLAESR